MPDDIPTLASLRRKHRPPAATPSLFDPPAISTPPAPPGPPAPPEQVVFSVAELVRRVRSLVERTHGHVTVEGEISNWRPAASGHCYFTLKDGDAQLSIVLFRRQAALLRFKPRDGDAVRVSGSLSIYEQRGQLQLVAESMQQVGFGALLAAVQALKDKLRREGVFANQRPLPSFPRCIGIVTSLQGAALRDIVKVCRRRHAAVNLLIYPAAVQGPNCAREVAAGVRWFSFHPNKADVVLVARGGGSWEDLHGFDDEALARTIAACSIPVITGIGHATDSTIADAAADLCAPTPSAAAELVTAAQHTIEARLDRLHQRLLRSSRYELLRTRQRLSALTADAILNRVQGTLERRSQHLDDLTDRTETAVHRTVRNRSSLLLQLDTRLYRQHPHLRLAGRHHRLDTLLHQLNTLRITQALRMRLDRATSSLEALSPLRVLERGYALVYGPDGKLLRDAANAAPNSQITAKLAKGRIRAMVTTTE